VLPSQGEEREKREKERKAIINLPASQVSVNITSLGIKYFFVLVTENICT